MRRNGTGGRSVRGATADRPSEGERGQAGIDRLALFLAGVVVFLAALPVVLGALGVDPGPTGGATAGEADDTTPGELVVLGARGGAVDAGRTSVGTVDLAVTASGGPVALSDLSITVVGTGADSPYLLPAGATGGGSARGSFGVETDGDRTLTPGERATLTIDLGTDDVPDVSEVGRRLRAGSTVTLVLDTGNGTQEVELAVPKTLSGEGVSLSPHHRPNGR
jgi:archaellin